MKSETTLCTNPAKKQEKLSEPKKNLKEYLLVFLQMCVCVCVLVHMFIYSLISQCVLFCDQSDQMTTHSNFVRILILLCRELFSNPLYLFGSFFFIGLIFFHFPHVVEFFFFIFYKGFTLQFLIFFSFNLFSFYFF